MMKVSKEIKLKLKDYCKKHNLSIVEHNIKDEDKLLFLSDYRVYAIHGLKSWKNPFNGKNFIIERHFEPICDELAEKGYNITDISNSILLNTERVLLYSLKDNKIIESNEIYSDCDDYINFGPIVKDCFDENKPLWYEITFDHDTFVKFCEHKEFQQLPNFNYEDLPEEFDEQVELHTHILREFKNKFGNTFTLCRNYYAKNHIYIIKALFNLVSTWPNLNEDKK